MPFLAEAPAPVAMASGRQPMMNAKLVMRIGRRRRPAASIAALTGSMPRSTRTFANSTMRIAFFAARPMIMMMPICM